MGMLWRLIINAVSLWQTVVIGKWLGIGISLTHGADGALAAVIAVIVLALVNVFIRPLILLLTLPLNCLTLGLFTLVVNGLLFWMVGSLNMGLKVDNFTAGLYGSVTYSILSAVITKFLTDPDKEK